MINQILIQYYHNQLIKRILCLLVVGLGVLSCGNDKFNYFPQYPVYIKIDTNLLHKQLAPIGTMMRFVAGHTPNLTAGSQTGFGGILVVHDLDGTFYAFDLACPVELTANVRVQERSDVSSMPLSSTCPKCGSVFDLTGGFAYPVSGQAKEMRRSLHRYSVAPDRDGTTYWVRP